MKVLCRIFKILLNTFLMGSWHCSKIPIVKFYWFICYMTETMCLSNLFIFLWIQKMVTISQNSLPRSDTCNFFDMNSVEEMETIFRSGFRRSSTIHCFISLSHTCSSKQSSLRLLRLVVEGAQIWAHSGKTLRWNITNGLWLNELQMHTITQLGFVTNAWHNLF